MIKEMMEHDLDRELLRQQRKIRKKEKKEARRLEKQQEKEKHVVQLEIKSTKVSVITSKPNDTTIPVNDKNNFPSLTESGLGKNKHVRSNMPTQIPLESLIKDTKQQHKKQSLESTTSKTSTYLGNRLDSSQPVRYQGKHREEPKKKRPSRLKSEICLSEEQRKNMPEQELILYCDNIVSDELKEATKNFIKKIVELQENAYLRNPEKAKKRYVVGFHEIKKYMSVKKVKVLVIADDLKIFNEEDSLYKIIQELVELAKNGDVPYLYGLKRSKIGNLTRKYRPVSCFAVLNHQSAEEELGLVLKNVVRIETEVTDESKDDYSGILQALKD